MTEKTRTNASTNASTKTRTNAQGAQEPGSAQMPLYGVRGIVQAGCVRTSADPAYRIERIGKDTPPWINFRFLTRGPSDQERTCRLAWNGERFARTAALATAARRSPRELEALTAWLEAGRP